MSDLLAFQSVRMARPDGSGAEELSLALGPRQVVWVADSAGALPPPVADTACGLLQPASGKVLFNGVDWTDMAPDGESSARGLIGRIFRARPWLANLDMDENIVLAEVHKGGARSRLVGEARDLAARIGLAGGIPAKRPAWITPVESALCQWVRALLGNKTLLLLEDPFQALDDAHRDLCLAALLGRLEAGAGALIHSPESPPAALISRPGSVTITPSAARRSPP